MTLPFDGRPVVTVTVVCIVAATAAALGLAVLDSDDTGTNNQTDASNDTDRLSQPRECPDDMTPVTENGTLAYCVDSNVDGGNDTPQ